MSARNFKSVVTVGVVAGAALGCYLVSLNVASQRASLEQVESSILKTQRDIRNLETEIGTRGRLAQLERWNVKVIQLSAPTADQFVDNGFQLATLVKPETRSAIQAPVVLASAPKPEAAPKLTHDGDIAPAPAASPPLGAMIHVASYSRPAVSEARASEMPLAKAPAAKPTTAKTSPTPAKPTLKAAAKAIGAKPATKPVKTAMSDPLSPLPKAPTKAKAAAAKVKE